ncbi:MAG: hypothetical protein L0387_44545 [Acidobacteria bacterium]|nr:hypothetical protein [Acidobacteriota bacterium]
MPDDTILCWTWPEQLGDLLSQPSADRHVTVKDCNGWLDEGDDGRRKLAAFFRQRMQERYVHPVERLDSSEKNGFAIMAISCLLIESLETFRQGWDSTEKNGRSPLAFCYFFDREQRFEDFKGLSPQFYKHVRCGILHQGETTGGWTIRRDGTLFDRDKRRINATEFHRQLTEVIREYADLLLREPAGNEVWRRFRHKVGAMIRNCEARP